MVPQPASYVSSILAERAFTEDAWYKQAVWVNCSPISQVGRLRGLADESRNADQRKLRGSSVSVIGPSRAQIGAGTMDGGYGQNEKGHACCWGKRPKVKLESERHPEQLPRRQNNVPTYQATMTRPQTWSASLLDVVLASNFAIQISVNSFKHLHNNVSSSPTQYAHLDERRGAVLFSGDMARRWCVFSRASRTSVVCGTSAALCSSGPRPRLDRTMSSAACTSMSNKSRAFESRQ
eukprot:scaffold47053_cov17-Tisochrysis_lutea.AAC.1